MTAPRDWFDTDYYAVLGVAADADAKMITKAYRKLVRTLHPDTNPDNPSAEKRFKEVAAAYDIIGDEQKRAQYDEARQQIADSSHRGNAPGGGMFNFDRDQFGGGSFDDGGFGDGGFGDLFSILNQQRTPRRGRDLRAEVNLPFRDAIGGTRLTVTAGESVTCRNCHGTGVTGNVGCARCQGRGVEARDRTVTVVVPAGVGDGQTLKVPGKGQPGDRGAPAGDLLVEVHVGTDPVFTRHGLDVRVAVPVTFAEAALGADIAAPCVDGTTVTLRMKAGTQSGTVLRARNRGVQSKARRGDLLVEVRVETPTHLDDSTRQQIEALAPVLGEPRRGDWRRWARKVGKAR